jgi:hypothetical protein
MRANLLTLLAYARFARAKKLGNWEKNVGGGGGGGGPLPGGLAVKCNIWGQQTLEDIISMI